MNDHLPSAVEQQEASADSERAVVCADCINARAALLTELGAPALDIEADAGETLIAWAEAAFAHLEPRDLVASVVLAFQTDERQFDPNYDVTSEDPAEIEADIQLLLSELAATQRNMTTTAEIADGVPTKVPAEMGQESALLTTEVDLEGTRSALVANQAALLAANQEQLSVKAEKTDRNAELARLQTMFEQLLAEGGDTETALRTVIGQSEQVEIKQHLVGLLHRVTALQMALPDQSQSIQATLSAAPLDLAAPTLTASFAGFLAEVESNPAFSEFDRATIRRVIAQTEHDMRTGTKVYEAALISTTDPVTGEAVPLHTADNKAEVLPGVHAFTETGHDVVLEMKTPRRRMSIDVTGYDGATIGLVAEAMGFQAHLEELKATAFVREVYGVDFGLMRDPSFDPLSLIEMRQRLTALMGGAAGYDGRIFDPRDKSDLILTQMRLTSCTNSADGWGQDLHAAQAHIRSLGLDNLSVLEEFGRYTRLHYQHKAILPEALWLHLSNRFPDLVSAIGSTGS